MQKVTLQRCFNHGHREAVARCPECSRYFCRECITEHEDRVLCASCLSNVLRPSLVRRIRFRGFTRIVQFLGGVMLLWIFFYYLGQVLLSLPASFHEGTLWQTRWWQG